MSSTYPVIEKERASTYLNARRALVKPGSLPGDGSSTGKDSAVVKQRSAAPLTLDDAVIPRLVAKLCGLAATYPAKIKAVEGSFNDFDAEAAQVIADELALVPVAALVDKDFWRYLALHELFEIVAWRIPDSDTRGWGSNVGAGPNFARCYPYKAYLRGKLVREVTAMGYSWKDFNDVDFYDSHLFGRRTGSIPGMSAALNEIRSTLARSTDLRPFARKAGRVRGTVLTEVLTQAEARALL